MKIVLASSNPHKVKEVDQVLAPLGIEVVGLDAFAQDLPEPVEDADTFEGNARIKAIAYAQMLSLSCLAEDSGLEVDALGGAPGVYSARYAGIGQTRDERDRANNAKLLTELAKAEAAHAPEARDRSARFVCAMCLVDADGKVLFETRGTYNGVIAAAPHGAQGFGYDPLLYLPDLGKTSAELTSDEKNARSHRGQAARALAGYLAPVHE